MQGTVGLMGIMGEPGYPGQYGVNVSYFSCLLIILPQNSKHVNVYVCAV